MKTTCPTFSLDGVGSVPDQLPGGPLSRTLYARMALGEFLGLIPADHSPDSLARVLDGLDDGVVFANPVLWVNDHCSPQGPFQVTGHEGRHRALAAVAVTGDRLHPVVVAVRFVTQRGQALDGCPVTLHSDPRCALDRPVSVVVYSDPETASNLSRQ